MPKKEPQPSGPHARNGSRESLMGRSMQNVFGAVKRRMTIRNDGEDEEDRHPKKNRMRPLSMSRIWKRMSGDSSKAGGVYDRPPNSDAEFAVHQAGINHSAHTTSDDAFHSDPTFYSDYPYQSAQGFGLGTNAFESTQGVSNADDIVLAHEESLVTPSMMTHPDSHPQNNSRPDIFGQMFINHQVLGSQVRVGAELQQFDNWFTNSAAPSGSDQGDHVRPTLDTSCNPTLRATATIDSGKPDGEESEKSSEDCNDDSDQNESDSQDGDDKQADVADADKPCKCPYEKCLWRCKATEMHRLKEHLRRTHMKPFQCPICKDFPADQPQVKRHLATQHRGASHQPLILRPEYSQVIERLRSRGLHYREICKICKEELTDLSKSPEQESADADLDNISPDEPLPSFSRNSSFSQNPNRDSQAHEMRSVGGHFVQDGEFVRSAGTSQEIFAAEPALHSMSGPEPGQPLELHSLVPSMIQIALQRNPLTSSTRDIEGALGGICQELKELCVDCVRANTGPYVDPWRGAQPQNHFLPGQVILQPQESPPGLTCRKTSDASSYRTPVMPSSNGFDSVSQLMNAQDRPVAMNHVDPKMISGHEPGPSRYEDFELVHPAAGEQTINYDDIMIPPLPKQTY